MNSDLGRITRIERKLMSAEYMLDSTVSHVRQKKCDDIKPLTMKRIQKGLNDLRGGLYMLRLEAGIRHPTLFAGAANPKHESTRKQTQKTWGSHTPHKWRKDCDGP